MSKQILVVDDSPSMREVIKMTLADKGFSVQLAADGKDALAVIENNTFDLIISDLNMPNMNGIEMTKAVRASGSHRFTPILMLTTESENSKKMEGKEAGVRAWLVKPFKPDILLTAINRLI